MTNRDKIVKELINHESRVYLYFLCPYIPGEPGAHCKPGEEVDGQIFCRSCIEEWLDREIEAPKEEANEYYSKMLAAVPDIPDDECGKEFTAPCPCGGTIKAMRSVENVHIPAYCEKCGFRMHE